MTQDAALLVRVNVRDGGDHLYAASADLPGLHICASDREALCASTIKAVKALFKHNRGMDVDVMPVASESEFFPDMPISCVSDQFVVQRMAVAA